MTKDGLSPTDRREPGQSSGVSLGAPLWSAEQPRDLAPAAPAADECHGSDAAFRQHFGLVWRSLRRLGVKPGQLDDAAQDVFLVVHRRWGQQEGCSLTTWIYGVAVRVASDYRRRVRRHARVENLEFDPPAAGATPEQEVQLREAGQLLHHLLSSLKPKQREVFVAVELEQLSVPEVARALGLRLNTAYTRLRAARRSFERALHQCALSAGRTP